MVPVLSHLLLGKPDDPDGALGQYGVDCPQVMQAPPRSLSLEQRHIMSVPVLTWHTSICLGAICHFLSNNSILCPSLC